MAPAAGSAIPRMSRMVQAVRPPGLFSEAAASASACAPTDRAAGRNPCLDGRDVRRGITVPFRQTELAGRAEQAEIVHGTFDRNHCPGLNLRPAGFEQVGGSDSVVQCLRLAELTFGTQAHRIRGAGMTLVGVLTATAPRRTFPSLSAGSLPEVLPSRIHGSRDVNPAPGSGQCKGGRLHFPMQPHTSRKPGSAPSP